MKRRFTDRVTVERKVLTLLNMTFKSPPLNGLSEKAIQVWAKGNEAVTKDVEALVGTISKRARLDVDASRDVFIEGELDLTDSLEGYIEQLVKLVNK